MLAVNCRAYQAALILFDTIKRVANRECTTVPINSASIPAHTTVPFFDHLEPPASFSNQSYPDSANQNTEEKLKNVMSAWFSKDAISPISSTIQPNATAAPVITPVHQSSGSQISAGKRSNESDWLHVYPPQSTANLAPQTSPDVPPSNFFSLP